MVTDPSPEAMRERQEGRNSLEMSDISLLPRRLIEAEADVTRALDLVTTRTEAYEQARAMRDKAFSQISLWEEKYDVMESLLIEERDAALARIKELEAKACRVNHEYFEAPLGGYICRHCDEAFKCRLDAEGDCVLDDEWECGTHPEVGDD